MPTTMPPVQKVAEAEILQFLTAARETIAAVPVCWLATRWDLFAGTPGFAAHPRKRRPRLAGVS
jgi:predicted pyridoxine 5'-phosphate oxidase superfamily flavin-nucleotide-binding protein